MKDKIITLYKKYAGNCAKVGQELGVSREWVRQVVKEFGLKGVGKKGRKAKDFSEKELLKIKKTFSENNYNLTLTSEKLGQPYHLVRDIIARDAELSTKKCFRYKYTKEEVLNALQQAGGNKSEAARLLNIRPMGLYRLIGYYGIKGEDYEKSLDCRA